MTRQAGTVKTHRIIVLASMAVAIFFVGSALLGKQVLSFFNVGLDNFRIAGGLLALMIAFEMFQAQYGKFIQIADETARDEVDIHGLAITPFAFPLLVGPAELSIMILSPTTIPDGLPRCYSPQRPCSQLS
jgi:small neutral amino acid transporter SnatA (MarC family)